MTRKKNQHSEYINPYRKTDLKFWALKWNITMHQVKDLLGVTGSSRVDILQNYLQRAGLLQSNHN
ncbi:MAG: hypothetical protein ABIT08_17665 [Bacteroidia bacterium]